MIHVVVVVVYKASKESSNMRINGSTSQFNRYQEKDYLEMNMIQE